MPRKKLVEFESNGRCFAYLRVSTHAQAASGNGLQAQSDRVIREAKKRELTFRQDTHYDTLKPPRPGFFVDAGKSAFGKGTFGKRTAAGLLLDYVEPGDTVLISKLDRGWRSVVDFCNTCELFIAKGVRLIICTPQINLGTATGRMLAKRLAVLAEWESDRKGERISAALAVKKANKSLQTASASKSTDWSESDWRPSSDANSESERPELEAGRIIIYTRCSHRESFASGLGLLDQAQIARKYSEWLMENNSNLRMGPDFVDAIVSASSKEIRERPAGKMMDDELRAGDHVVFSALDRGFRCVRDIYNTLPIWKERGIHVHFATEGFSMDDESGKQLASAVCEFAEMEADMISQRTKEVRAIREAEGKFCGGENAPVFYKAVLLRSGQKKLMIEERQVRAYRIIKFMRHHFKMSVADACDFSERAIAKWEKRIPIPPGGIARFTKLSKQLPAWYPRDANGTAFPVFNRARFLNTNVKQREQALESWAKYAAELRSRGKKTECAISPCS